MEETTNNIPKRTFFNAAWRPFIGWICGLSLLYAFIVQPLLVIFIFSQIPSLETPLLLTLLGSLLGMGGLRTYEKVKKVAE